MRIQILKQQKHRSPLTPLDVEEEPDTTLAKQSRRVSFASSNFVKYVKVFCNVLLNTKPLFFADNSLQIPKKIQYGTPLTKNL